jgi:hypothetical protein
VIHDPSTFLQPSIRYVLFLLATHGTSIQHQESLSGDSVRAIMKSMPLLALLCWLGRYIPQESLSNIAQRVRLALKASARRLMAIAWFRRGGRFGASSAAEERHALVRSGNHKSRRGDSLLTHMPVAAASSRRLVPFPPAAVASLGKGMLVSSPSLVHRHEERSASAVPARNSSRHCQDAANS